MLNSITRLITLTGLFLLSFVFGSLYGHAEVNFVSASNSATLSQTIDEDSERVFIFSGLTEGASADIVFSTNSTCPGVAMSGGAEFTSVWSCNNGVINVSVVHRGGLSFGPSSEDSEDTFYVTFSEQPAEPGSSTTPAELSGIQLAVFGDVNRWDLNGEQTSNGTSFGVELSGARGGSAHFRMYLPAAAATYLGGVLGVFIEGKADPFASVTSNEDGSVDIKVDIASLSSGNSEKVAAAAEQTVTKKITAGARSLSIGFDKTKVKTGKSVKLAVCSGAQFTAGDKIPVKFTVGGKASSLKKTVTLDETGCAQSSVKLKSVSLGTLTAKIKYKGENAKGTVKISK